MSEADEAANFLLSTDSYIVSGLGRLDFSVEGFRVDAQGSREIGHEILPENAVELNTPQAG